ncbi:reverse transcriptase [Abeliophyllum distichum]|uniref:Reverse transcriptase n=1 Tax=Abeliophyllum distichum TaxID=126358 RepID=A0ABD1PCE7_9LAMI
MKKAQDRQKSYADKNRKYLEFAVGDKVFLKVKPIKGVLRFSKKGKLIPRKYVTYPTNVMKLQPLEIQQDLSYEEVLMKGYAMLMMRVWHLQMRSDLKHSGDEVRIEFNSETGLWMRSELKDLKLYHRSAISCWTDEQSSV